MLRYKLRTLLIVLTILPPLLWIGWTKYEAWKAEQERQRIIQIYSSWVSDLDLQGYWRVAQPPEPLVDPSPPAVQEEHPVLLPGNP